MPILSQSMPDTIKELNRVVWVGIGINLFLMVFKLSAGMLAHSEAIVADAVHTMSDLSTDVAVLFGLKWSVKPIDDSHNYGHGKIETLVAALIGITLFLVGGRILWQGAVTTEAVLKGGLLPRPGLLALCAAGFSIVTKEWLYRYTLREGRKAQSSALIANAWDHRSDALSSIAVFISITGAIFLGERWRILDPIAAVMVSIFILYAAITILRQSANELMEASLDDDLKQEILRVVRSIKGAENPHDLKTRRIGKHIAIDIHIETEPTLSIVQAHDIATKVELRLRKAFGKGTFISVHMEPLGDSRR